MRPKIKARNLAQPLVERSLARHTNIGGGGDGAAAATLLGMVASGGSEYKLLIRRTLHCIVYIHLLS